MTVEGETARAAAGSRLVQCEAEAERFGDDVPTGLALCLSGGGYRAMLFHLGALWRLNELGYLRRLDRISSVSGGSITAGLLGMRWDELERDFDERGVAASFERVVAAPLHDLAGRTIDVGAVVRGLLWRGSVGNRIAGAYRRHLFGGATLQDLPDRPRFVINATNLQSGALWRFSKPYMADYKVGRVPSPKVELALAVAASSAFPPFLSPVELRLGPGVVERFETGSAPELHREPFTRKVVLSDGGVYDNLGLETAVGSADTLLVSDGGGSLRPVERPWRNWPGHALRTLFVVDSQVRALRARSLFAGGHDAATHVALWTIRTPVDVHRAPGALAVPAEETRELATVGTRLRRLPRPLQRRLVNWGYASCDAAMRAYVAPDAAPPDRPPYEIGGAG